MRSPRRLALRKCVGARSSAGARASLPAGRMIAEKGRTKAGRDACAPTAPAEDIVAIGYRGSCGVIGEMRFGCGDDPGGEKGAFCIRHCLKKAGSCRVTKCCRRVTNCRKGANQLLQTRYQMLLTRNQLSLIAAPDVTKKRGQRLLAACL